MWEKCSEKCKAFGVSIEMSASIIEIEKEGLTWSVSTLCKKWTGFDYVLSSAPIRDLLPLVRPSFPQIVLDAVSKLSYRDFIVVVLICEDKDAFMDNWIYIHDPDVRVGRIQNYKSWSPYMVPDQKMACYGLEYFCFQGDGLWSLNDEDLIELGKAEIHQIGLINPDLICDGYVVRQSKAYPVYDRDYKTNVNVIRSAIKLSSGLSLIGRNGMHKYNNQDHSMMTAILAAKNIIAGKEIYDLWEVNEDAEYHESGNKVEASSIIERNVPQNISKKNER
jgi:protoporphyrinogen oxidase